MDGSTPAMDEGSARAVLSEQPSRPMSRSRRRRTEFSEEEKEQLAVLRQLQDAAAEQTRLLKQATQHLAVLSVNGVAHAHAETSADDDKQATKEEIAPKPMSRCATLWEFVTLRGATAFLLNRDNIIAPYENISLTAALFLTMVALSDKDNIGEALVGLDVAEAIYRTIALVAIVLLGVATLMSAIIVAFTSVSQSDEEAVTFVRRCRSPSSSSQTLAAVPNATAPPSLATLSNPAVDAAGRSRSLSPRGSSASSLTSCLCSGRCMRSPSHLVVSLLCIIVPRVSHASPFCCVMLRQFLSFGFDHPIQYVPVGMIFVSTQGLKSVD